MIKWAVVLFIIAVATIQSAHSKSFPSYITPCKRKDPNLNKCLLTFIDTILKRAPKGIPELKIPALEPFVIPKIVLDQGSSKSVNLKATFNKVAVAGITTANLKEVKAFMEAEPRFEIVFSIPSVKLQSDYELDGKLLVVPIKGSGKSDIKLTDVSGVVEANTKVVEKKGSSHLHVEKRNVEVDVKNAQFHFDNLFNGNKELSETTNKFMNENWQELYKELRPVIADAIGGVIDYVLEIVLDDYAYNDIFPEN